MWHSLYNRLWQNLDIQHVQNIRKLQVHKRDTGAINYIQFLAFSHLYAAQHSLMQWTAGVSSKRFRQTVQNFLLWCVGSDQQWATGFCKYGRKCIPIVIENLKWKFNELTLIKHGAIPEHGVTTLVTHFSWTMKLQTEMVERMGKTSLVLLYQFHINN